MARAPRSALAFVAALQIARTACAASPASPASDSGPAPSALHDAGPAPSGPAAVAPMNAVAPPLPPAVVAPPIPLPALTPPTDAVVHVAIGYHGAHVEGRSRVDTEEWRVLCDAPCDRSIRVDGIELRVTAPRMTPSNAFLVEPGPGTAGFRVRGGSAEARTLGIIGLAGGLPVAFAGLSLFGIGSIHGSSGERIGGIVTLAVGAVVTLAALPLLLAGSTSVRNGKGKEIARGTAQVPLL